VLPMRDAIRIFWFMTSSERRVDRPGTRRWR
jgi:hypothetical protein